MRPCPACGRRTQPHGRPQRLGAYLDQIIVCPACDWCGVESIEAPPELTNEPTQLEFDL